MAKSITLGWILMVVFALYNIIASVILLDMQVVGVAGAVFLFQTGVAIGCVAVISYREGQKWSWWFLLFIGILVLLICSTVHGLDIWTIVGWIMFVPAIIIPAAAILCRKELK